MYVLIKAQELERLDIKKWKAYAEELLRDPSNIKGNSALQQLWETTDRLSTLEKADWPKRRSWLWSNINSLVRFGDDGGLLTPGLCRVLSGADGDMGCSARILLCENEEELLLELDRVAHWGELLSAAYIKLIRSGILLPPSFFRQTFSALAEIAAQLPKVDPCFTHTIIGMGLTEAPETLAQLIWMLDLTVAAMRAESWEDKEFGVSLCKQFGWLAEVYLTNVYRPELLNEEDVTLLPGMYAFGWCYLRSRQAAENADPVEAVRMLRLGLLAAPGMKRTVEFLAMCLEQSLTNPGSNEIEFMELAKQVKEKLAVLRAEGVEGLDEVLDSPVYTKFQPLLERQ